MALAFHDKKVFKAQTTADLRKMLPQVRLLLDSPADLFTAAWPQPIAHFVERHTPLPPGTRHLNNNPNYWFEALLKMAISITPAAHKDSVKNNFTFKPPAPIKEKQEIKMTSTEPKRKHLNKSLKITKKMDGNPRRKDTNGFKSWEIIKDGMTIAEFIQAGGRKADLLWDFKKGHVALS